MIDLENPEVIFVNLFLDAIVFPSGKGAELIM